jgi:hypothetical protein
MACFAERELCLWKDRKHGEGKGGREGFGGQRRIREEGDWD